MPKYIIKEGIIEKFLSQVIDAAKKNKIKYVTKRLSKVDPELAKKVEKLEDDWKDIDDFLRKKMKNDALELPDKLK